MESFAEFTSSLNEAIAQEELNKRVTVTKGGNFKPEFNLNVGSDSVIGAVSFGSSLPHRSLIVDKNYKYDAKLAGTIYTARIQNSMTQAKGGFVVNATLAKFNLKKGTMWLAEDEDESGKIIWGRGFKFKNLNLNLEVAVEHGWIV